MAPTSAFILDVFCRPEGMVLYLVTDQGRRVRVCDRFTPSMYLGGTRREVLACLRTLEGWQEATYLGPTERTDFWTGEPRRVAEVRLESPWHWHRGLLDRLYRLHPDVDYYNADLLPEQHYAFARNIVLAGWCDFEMDGDGRLTSLASTDDPWNPDFVLPDLVMMEMEGEGTLHGNRPRLDHLTVRVEGREHCLDGGDGAEMIASLDRLLRLHDPDIVLTRGGDHFLVPLLLVLQGACRDGEGCEVGLCLDREPPPAPREVRLEGRSFFSYGRVMYQAPDYPFYGRWHIDTENSFMMDHAGLEGLVEVTRVSRMPAQRLGRRSIGTGITSIQLNHAFREGFLIPWKKAVPEGWKTAAQLLASDRGGLVYQPLVGAWEDVVEIDFVSMYPTIMADFNVSPETVNCRCCDNDDVPELGYTICRNRRGLVSRALEPVITKRVEYKRRRGEARSRGEQAAAAVVDARQTALKWLLVCCFGYLGYRNARFGRIEAHEAVCAFARDRLLAAREVCERHGFRVLHAIVDCFWCQRDPEHGPAGRPTPEEIDALCVDIRAATGLPIALEGVYRWIAFLPSRQDPVMPVPNRFYGVFEDGSMKVRGVEARRHDLPPYIRNFQRDCLELLAQCATLRECRDLVPVLRERLADSEGALWRGEVPLGELLITQSLSRAPSEYRSNAMIAIAARQGVQAGFEPRAGQSVSYLITSRGDADIMRRVCLAPLLQPDTTCDAAAYIRLLRRAFQSVLYVVGLEIDEEPGPPPGTNGRQARKTATVRNRHEPVQADLFE